MADPGLHPVVQLLEDSLSLLAREAPVHFAALQAELSGLDVRLVVGRARPSLVRLDGGPPWVAPMVGGRGPARLAIRVTEDCLDAIVAGSLSLARAAECGDLYVRGSVDEVIRLARAVEAWVHGALRSPTFPELGERYSTMQRHGFVEPDDLLPEEKGSPPWADREMKDARSS